MVNKINALYYDVMDSTLNNGYMGADECLFTILSHRHSDLIHRFEIDSNGLLWPFFENLKEFSDEKIKNNDSFLNPLKCALYVITFNSPSQFETLIKSMIQYDQSFIDKPKKYLLDNSTDLSTTPQYIELCRQYGFEHIKKVNLGICGGRQFIAEHFETTGMDYYFFFEDDMFFYPKKDSVCRNGFNRYFDDLYMKSLKIIKKENFDFLKLNYSEFYGDNGTQWAWYNVPQHVRDEYWPNNNKLPQIGFDSNAPKTNFNRIFSNEGIPYADGEIYYCNWPQIVSKTGNKKMFLDVKWKSPYEQTWMSHIYQETKKGNIKPGLILGTPTEHNRFDFYPKEERKEN
jgi:hypothetical protein